MAIPTCRLYAYNCSITCNGRCVASIMSPQDRLQVARSVCIGRPRARQLPWFPSCSFALQVCFERTKRQMSQKKNRCLRGKPVWPQRSTGVIRLQWSNGKKNTGKKYRNHPNRRIMPKINSRHLAISNASALLRKWKVTHLLAYLSIFKIAMKAS